MARLGEGFTFHATVETEKTQSQEQEITSADTTTYTMTRLRSHAQNSNDNSPHPPQTQTAPPPGPSGYPFVGSSLQWKGPETNLEWTKRYGSIYRVKMGSKELVYLNSVELVEKYMEGRNGESYLDRPMGPAAIAEGLLFGSGELWKKNKRAFMKALYTVTFEAHMEEAVKSEIDLTMEELHKNVNKPIKIGDFLLPTCANAVAGLLLGESLPSPSVDRKELLTIAQSMEGVDLTSLLTQISLKQPKFRDLLLFFVVDIHGTSKRLQNLLRQWIRQANSDPMSPTSPRIEASAYESSTPASSGCPFHFHKRIKVSTDETDSCQEACKKLEAVVTPPHNDKNIESAMINATNLVAFGFTDTGHGEQPFEEALPPLEQSVPFSPTITEHQWKFDRQMSLNLKKESILQRILKQPEFADVTEGTDLELLQSLIDMFFGGVTSTLSAMEFILAHLTRNPDFQRLAQKEVDEQVKKNDGVILWSMKKDMPYIQACITEALRLGSVTPSSLPHVATKETEIEGYSIPKGTFVVASIYSMHRDPSYYLDPDVYRPQRHLTGRGGTFKQPTSYKPYGVGARRCVGVKMAEMQLFVYTVYILKHFELHPVNNKSKPSLETHMRIINRLKDFRCVLKRRDYV